METPYFKVKRLSPEAVLPSKREEDAGYDIYACPEEDFILLRQSEIFLMPTKLSMQIPKDWVLYVAERGSTGSKGIAKRCGIIDSGYRGEVFIVLNNTSTKPVVFAKKEGESLAVFLEEMGLGKEEVTIYPLTKAIAQCLLLYAPHAKVEEVEGLEEKSERGSGALGSSKK